MQAPDSLIKILNAHVPETSIGYCIQLWEESPFSLHVLRPRLSKLGDFRFRKDRKIQTITLNQDLNPYQFLLTFIHEVAHLRIFQRLGPNHAPHGKEWKSKFKELMIPILHDQIFPQDILVPLRIHLQNPSASSTRDLFLMKEMSKYDLAKKGDIGKVFLTDLMPGNCFLLAGKKFRKGETRRTRVLCEEIPSGKKFLISKLAKVTPA